MNREEQRLGTQLRQLLAELDGGVQQAYDASGVRFRPRFYPIMQLLIEVPSASVNEVAAAIGVSQPAATQTLNEMKSFGIIEAITGEDRRSRMVRLTQAGRDLAQRLGPLWSAVHQAAADLDRELPAPLAQVLSVALNALDRQSFHERIQSRLTKGAVQQ